MSIWIIAILIVAILGTMGYYLGAVRLAVSFLGILTGALLAFPVGGLWEMVLPVVGIEHPVMLAIFSPIFGFATVVIAFLIVGQTVHQKLETYYKYQGSDTRRLLFARMNERVGICIGLADGTVLVILISLFLYVVGYGTHQFGGAKSDHFVMKTVNFLASGLAPTGMDKAVAPFNPAPVEYFDGADILADIFHTPLLRSRLSTYPPFLPLSERSEFKNIADNAEFLEFWDRGPDFREFSTNRMVAPLIEDIKLYNELTEMVGSDLEDLRGYLETGESEKYGGIKILGKWKFTLKASKDRAIQRKNNMSFNERKKLSIFLRANFTDAELQATLDEKFKVNAPTGETKGSWSRVRAGKYILTTPEGKMEATIADDTITFMSRGYPIVFRRQ